jgi:hypothetical protein
MKLLHSKVIRSVASAICLHGAIASAQADEKAPEKTSEKAPESDFPYVIQPELGSIELAPGDRIVITSIRGNREHIERGGRYFLSGSYTLASADEADLSWFITTRGPSGATPINAAQHVIIKKGSGNFHLEKDIADDGWMHITFYVGGHSHGGIYFGEKGFENSVLRKKGWSDFPAVSTEEAHGTPPGAGGNDQAAGSARSNRLIMDYLGDPVRPPSTLSETYSPANLLAVFTAVSKKRGVEIKKLEVDDSEFPFLVYGVLAGKPDLGPLETDLRQTTGYAYGGAVVGSTGDGSTYFSMNIIPYNQYPPGQAAACSRRLMVRLQMLSDAIRQAK